MHAHAGGSRMPVRDRRVEAQWCGSPRHPALRTKEEAEALGCVGPRCLLWTAASTAPSAGPVLPPGRSGLENQLATAGQLTGAETSPPLCREVGVACII